MFRPEENIQISHRGEASVRLDMDRIRSSIPRIDPVFLNTPQYSCPALGAALDCEIILKLETANPIRCFKARGTETAMARLADSPDLKAAVCASAGNLGQALAYSAHRRGISTTVVAGSGANPYKLERIRASGAAVRIVDGDIEDARDVAQRIAASEGAFLLEDGKNLDTCEGAGTIAIELFEGVGPIDAVFLALGGGALATGVGRVQMPRSAGRNCWRAAEGCACDGIVMESAFGREDGPRPHDRGRGRGTVPYSGSPRRPSNRS
jgi:threonine dehydratase